MKTIEFINEKGLNSLTTELGIEVKEYPEHNIVLLNYDQIESPKFDPVVKECRGLILYKTSSGYIPCCRSFDRFYNLNEDPNHEKFSITDAIAYEKVDGSLLRFWHHPSIGWCIATRGMAFAEGLVQNKTMTFFDLAIIALGGYEKFHDFTNKLDKEVTYICELVSPETRVVKPYKGRYIYSLAARHTVSGEYIDWNPEELLHPKKYKFNKMSDCILAAKDLNDLDEGYVLDLNGWRIKVKSPSYLAIAHLRGKGVPGEPRIVTMVCTGADSDYLGYFPEDEYIFIPWQNRLSKLIKFINDTYEECKDMSQKDFAIKIKDLPMAFILFNLRKGIAIHTSINDKISDKGKAMDCLINSLKYMDK